LAKSKSSSPVPGSSPNPSGESLSVYDIESCVDPFDVKNDFKVSLDNL